MNKKIFKRAVAMMMAAVLTVGAALPSSNVFASGSDEEKQEILTLEISIMGNIIFRRSSQVKDICLMKQSMRLTIPKNRILTRTFLLPVMWWKQ